ncbi:MAG: flagellar protein FlgN [Planctomycetes bacterium]|nr:flagellar protein FlgN [Planctomycetota bacterium]
MVTDTTLSWGAEDIRAFVEGLDRQHDIYSRMLELTEKQLSELEDLDSAESITLMMTQKQPLVLELEHVENQLAERKLQWQKVRETLPPNIAEFAQNKLADMQKTLRKLIDIETDASEIVQQGLAAGRQKLGAMSRKNLASRAYGQPAKPNPKFVDDQT